MSTPTTLLPFQPATMSTAQLAAVSFLSVVKRGKVKGSVDVTFHREDPSGLPQPPATPCGSSPANGYVYVTISAS